MLTQRQTLAYCLLFYFFDQIMTIEPFMKKPVTFLILQVLSLVSIKYFIVLYFGM